MRNEVAPVALQESVVELPAVIVLGEAEKEEMVGAEIFVTLTLAVAMGLVPSGPIHCMPALYVPAEEGVMESEPLVAYVPPWEPVQEVALVEDQVNVNELPRVMEVGFAETLTVGAFGITGFTVTVAVAVTEPAELVAVKV